MKKLYFAEFEKTFCVKVGEFPSYYDKDIDWHRLNLAKVRERNRMGCPKLWTKKGVFS